MQIRASGLIFEPMKMPGRKASPGGLIKTGLTALRVRLKHEERSSAMSKIIEPITEVVRDPKHPFRKIENQPRKAQRHRYERRKIKEFLHLADWLADQPA
jgi:hypothetical protein